jgi:hypothetical protein
VTPGDEVTAIHLLDGRPAHLPLRRRLERRAGGHDARQRLAVRQLAIREGTAVGRDDLSVACGERGAIDLPARRRLIDQHLARRGGSARQLRRHPRRGLRSEGAGIPGRLVGVGHHQRDRRNRYAQLVGDGLRERRADVLPDLHLARVDLHAAGLVDMDPRGDLRRRRVARLP